MFKNKKIRNWLITIVVVAVVVPLGAWMFSSAGASASTNKTEEKVVVIDVAETIEASGTLEARPFASLSWTTSGVVKKVYVQSGDEVKAGDVLMSLQSTSVPSNIISAQTDLVNAEKELHNLMNSNLNLALAEQTLADAKQAVDDAQKDVTKLDYRRASDDLLDQTQAEIDLANKQVSLAEDAYKAVKKRPDGDSLKAQALLNLTNARLERDNKQATLNWYLGTPSDLDAEKYRAAFDVAKEQVVDAQREVDRLKDGPTKADIAATQARVDAAQATINSLYIIAPFDGQVLAVNNVIGDLVDTNAVSVYVADMNHLYVETQVDESDVANVKVGQQAEVTLDALAGVTLTGQVTAINPVGVIVSDLVKYTVRIDLDKLSDDVFLPLGATADVVIKVTEPTASLAVPIATIQNDGKSEFVMVIQAGGSTRRVDVVSGAIVGDLVVVAGDLKDGDILQIVNSSGEG